MVCEVFSGAHDEVEGLLKEHSAPLALRAAKPRSSRGVLSPLRGLNLVGGRWATQEWWSAPPNHKWNFQFCNWSNWWHHQYNWTFKHCKIKANFFTPTNSVGNFRCNRLSHVGRNRHFGPDYVVVWGLATWGILALLQGGPRFSMFACLFCAHGSQREPFLMICE